MAVAPAVLAPASTLDYDNMNIQHCILDDDGGTGIPTRNEIQDCHYELVSLLARDY